MSLERRLREALRLTDGYQPSHDLFARLTRSIEEDRAHRKRVILAVLAVVAGLAALTIFLAVMAETGTEGTIGWPRWVLQVAVVATNASVLMLLGPGLRRFGRPLVEEILRLAPDRGERFTRLLDIAYYLVFSGMLLLSLNLDDPGALVLATSEQITAPVRQVAVFLLMLGIAHTVNLVVLPVVGLLFTSTSRRALRSRSAGPVSANATRADRVARAIVITVVLGAIAATLALVGVVLVSIAL
jgi:hypothetical protein